MAASSRGVQLAADSDVCLLRVTKAKLAQRDAVACNLRRVFLSLVFGKS